ncbi:MAG: sugar phosphate nucleotidyltransferase [Candidatus Helarchaeales archaeon]
MTTRTAKGDIKGTSRTEMERGSAVKTVVIPCAGNGVRISPFSKVLPKPMLPCGDKPLIQHTIEMCISMGIEKIILIIGSKKDNSYYFDIIKYYFGSGERFHDLNDRIKIEYVVQEKTLGIGHALSLVEPVVGNEPFLMLLGDEVYAKSNHHEMLASYQEGFAYVGLKKWRDKAQIRRNYTVKIKNGLVEELYEKPTNDLIKNNILGVGTYIFDKNIFKAIRNTPPSERGEIEITDSINTLIKQGTPVKGFFLTGKYLNVTFPEDLEKAAKLKGYK